MRGAVVVAAACFAFITSSAVDAAGVVGGGDDELVPTGKGWGQRPSPGAGPGQGAGQGQEQPPGQARLSGSSGSNGIFYHGGPLMIDSNVSGTPPHIYYIWYGNWSTNNAPTILENLASNIGGSPYLRINTTYSNGSGQHLSGNAAFVKSVNVDSSTHGTALSDAAVQAIVSDAIGSNALPTDSNGVYFVLTSAEVNETSGFCTQYCGWHTHATISNTDIKFAFVGNPDRCPSACEEQTNGPNGNAGADGMASIISHELEEATSDPDLNAWYDRRGQENADKCAWTFGTTYKANGALANMTLGSRNYLIQQNWVNASGGYCALKY